MKKMIFAFVVLTTITIASTSFKTDSAPPNLYPEIEAFFNSLDADKFDTSHLASLLRIKDDIKSSNLFYENTNLIFYCSENSFRSQASQVFIQTLCFKKYRKVRAYSAGVNKMDISPKLISFLTKVGYKVSKSEKDGQSIYEIKFSDKADPIIIFSKTVTDKSLPNKDITSIVVCDVANENDCAQLKTETTALNLPFQKVSLSDRDDKIEITIKSIATEMLYVTRK